MPNLEFPLEATGFFALRTPLLPFEDFENLSQITDPEAFRAQLRSLLQRPEILEALFVASPHLVDSLAIWQQEPDSKKGHRSEEALVRYLTRMMARPTPFGLFAGCSVGRLGECTHLELEDRTTYRRHTRLDADYLFALGEDLGQDPAVRQRLHYRPNSTLYTVAGRLHYAEARLRGRDRSYHLVAVDPNEYLEATLQRARDGAPLADLAQALVDLDPDGEITREDADAYLDQLVDTQILVSPLSPVVTGVESLHPLVEQCADLAPAVEERLVQIRETLIQLDTSGLGVAPERYREIARQLADLPTKVDLPRLFQVDMIKPSNATLGAAVVEELQRGIALLHYIADPPPENPLQRFREAFRERYEDAEVPLVEALDNEAGIGFMDEGVGSDASPLIAGLPFPAAPARNKVSWPPWTNTLLAKLEDLDWSAPLPEIEITAADLEELDSNDLPPLPAAMQAIATLAAPSAAHLASGEFQLFLRGAGGPSGANLLGRFCHADPELATLVEEHLRAEEALDPEALFAEVVHLPEGRLGNIIARPRLRRYEIPYLGRGAAPPEHQIPITDLKISVRGERIVLRSARLDRRVLPRLTSAHNFSSGRNLKTYRFLCQLQDDGVRGGLGWTWGALEHFAFLPRVRSGRLLLARARWRMGKKEITGLTRQRGSARTEAVAAWRAERRLPRRIVLADSDNELLVDLDNPSSVDAFLVVVGRRQQATLVEFFPDPEQLCAQGPEGHFTHELIVPFVARPTPGRKGASPSRKERQAQLSGEVLGGEAPAIRRSFPPGSEWLYLKLYSGYTHADRLLSEVLSPLLPHLDGSFDRWFFIRYSDPGWHLRLRFHGDPQVLHSEVLPALQRAAAQALDAGWLHRVQLDTYQREIERYGGAQGIELAEGIAHVDSEAVLAIVELLEGDDGAEARWKLALRGSALLLADLGFEASTQVEVAHRMQSSFAREHHFDRNLLKKLSTRLRQKRRELEGLLAAEWSEAHPLAPGFEILERRSERLRPLVDELRTRSATQRLTTPLEALAPSLVHMFNNRILRSHARAHEAVLYDYLHQLLRSQMLRGGRGPK